jgi:GlcNAc-P-P-Und epimerase
MTVEQVTKQIADFGLRPLESCVIFGGTGFIGTHFARFLLSNHLARNVILADIEAPNKQLWSNSTRKELKDERVRYVPVDVCSPIQNSNLPTHAELVLNLAAVHREPGHEPHEYFETNLHGAENVCNWATEVGCRTLLFTSSISPYGPTEQLKNEYSTPVPVTAYGASKLAAEKIHLGWQQGGVDRKLVIVRPGVVFGPGEGGNVTRLVRSVLKGYLRREREHTQSGWICKRTLSRHVVGSRMAATPSATSCII